MPHHPGSRLLSALAAAALLAAPLVALHRTAAAQSAAAQSSNPGLDQREAVVRTAAERAFILSQMRLFLGSVQALVADLAAGDMQAAATESAARGRGANPLTGMPPGMKAKETPAWSAMMGGARAGFDGMAQAASSGASATRVTAMLGETMKNCVACHSSYRLVEQ